MEIVAAVIGLFTSVIVSGVSLYGAKKLGIGTTQNQLVSTLKDLTEAQENRIEQLEGQVKSLTEESNKKDGMIAALLSRVDELEKALIQKVLKTDG